MNITNLIKRTKRPDAYAPGTTIMWEDEYISKQLLEVHLNQHIDLASRKESTITQTVEWILNKSEATSQKLNILDLGCGPGLYAEKLAEKGHSVTGLDISKNSIEYAAKSADMKGLDITYVNQDYLELDAENCFDIVMMIFTDFGVLSPDQRSKVLDNIHKALKLGGVLIFDVLNDNYTAPATKSWEMAEQGFWSGQPHLALTESFYYEQESVNLSQHTIVEDGGRTEIYRFWTHAFTDDQLMQIITDKEFKDIQLHKGIIPDCDLYRSKDVTFCTATK